MQHALFALYCLRAYFYYGSILGYLFRLYIRNLQFTNIGFCTRRPRVWGYLLPMFCFLLQKSYWASHALSRYLLPGSFPRTVLYHVAVAHPFSVRRINCVPHDFHMFYPVTNVFLICFIYLHRCGWRLHLPTTAESNPRWCRHRRIVSTCCTYCRWVSCDAPLFFLTLRHSVLTCLFGTFAISPPHPWRAELQQNTRTTFAIASCVFLGEGFLVQWR